MDNHRQELPPSVARKLDYVQCQMQESVSQMLYYARLKSVHKDYLLEPLCLEECCQNALGDYKPLLEENRFCLSLDLPGVTVLSDQRGVEILQGQRDTKTPPLGAAPVCAGRTDPTAHCG